ncbi:hypothetical protein I3760_16G068100 [Carya illinoinensis]|uniref:NADH-ubiquinone oxidoreductase chain 1 n=1 Tax=Carya illinoinensis TaxID=32201 RepID=A0A8T1N7M6_CARIL|nr:NADH-ubiquinone oxidoreductase chain 1 [Carya illinoinensis]KAG2664186.1 hypothetical protein I3760_16G068100 [Carya illinoinensis]KAG6625047.1 hypothetical protein CIPAW_16G068400 [Carya illinoinensis]
MAFVQRRKGPDVVGSFGLLQPLADGLKLILKEPISPSSANFSLFRMAPVATFMLSLVARAVVPFDYGMVLSDPNIGLLSLQGRFSSTESSTPREGKQHKVNSVRPMNALNEIY